MKFSIDLVPSCLKNKNLTNGNLAQITILGLKRVLPYLIYEPERTSVMFEKAYFFVKGPSQGQISGLLGHGFKIVAILLKIE
jgi:hypothetical protein